MALPELAVILLAAGQGTRMRSSRPKVLHPIGGRAMLDWAIDLATAAAAARIVVVAGAHSPEVGAHAARRLGEGAVVVQDPPLGTGHAVRTAEAALSGFTGDVLVCPADAPLIRPESVAAMRAARAQAEIVVLGFEAADPTGYGRLILGADGALERIVEHRDASPEERAVRLCNSAVILFSAPLLFELLARVTNDNATGEYYLTDVIGLARAAGRRIGVARASESEVQGVNGRAQLAAAEAAFQARRRAEALERGVTLIDPSTVFFSHDTELAEDVTIEPNVFFGPGVRVGPGAVIHAFSHLSGAAIGPGAEVGPFARLRPGAVLEEGAKVGNFVELKNARLGAGAKANHLSYLGDAEVGARANVGAGAITCNYDGLAKHRTVIGEEAFIGSNTALVAPVTVGARAYTGSGSVITRNVPEGALAVSRARQKDIAGWADAFRARSAAAKAERGSKGGA